jgi:hypothetical protein
VRLKSDSAKVKPPAPPGISLASFRRQLLTSSWRREISALMKGLGDSAQVSTLRNRPPRATRSMGTRSNALTKDDRFVLVVPHG